MGARHAERSEASHTQRVSGARGVRFLAALGMTLATSVALFATFSRGLNLPPLGGSGLAALAPESTPAGPGGVSAEPAGQGRACRGGEKRSGPAIGRFFVLMYYVPRIIPPLPAGSRRVDDVDRHGRRGPGHWKHDGLLPGGLRRAVDRPLREGVSGRVGRRGLQAHARPVRDRAVRAVRPAALAVLELMTSPVGGVDFTLSA